MASRSLMLLRSAIRDPGAFEGHSTGDRGLDDLWGSWSGDDREALRLHEGSGALAAAMDDVFLSGDFSPTTVRDHPVLGGFLGGLADERLDGIRGMMAAKGACKAGVNPPV